MRILISSHVFAPSVGGIEEVGDLLAREFALLGHEVRVVTQTEAASEAATPYLVYRRPGIIKLLGLLAWCDVYLQNNISLATLWPALLLRRPTCIAYHTWITRPNGDFGWRERLKFWAARLVSCNITISEAMASALPVTCTVIPNPYRDDIFSCDSQATRSRDLVFLGRLVSDKGVDILLEALVLLRECGLSPSLSIIGSGPEEAALRAQCEKSKLQQQVTFLGSRRGADLCRELNRHDIMVIPSRWNEPFGIVALEGVACGCVIVGSSGGGLADAIGFCGVTYINGDIQGLAAGLETMLSDSRKKAAAREAAGPHLERHRRRAVAEAYLAVFHGAAS